LDNPYQNQIDSGFGVLFVIYMVIMVAVYVVTAIGLWKMFVKAGRPGWAAIVPVYNWWVWVEIIERPRWWFWVLVGSVLLSWVPIVGIVLSIAMFVLYLLGCLDMVKRFGKGTGYGIGLWLLPFVFAPILGFGSARFEGSGSDYTTPRQAAPENTIVPPPPAPPAAPTPLMTAPAPFGMPPAPAESMPPAPLTPMPGAPSESMPPAPLAPMPSSTAPAPAESMPPAPLTPMPGAPSESMPPAPLAPMPSSTAPASAPVPFPAPSDSPGSPPPYTLAPPRSPVPPLGSWPPAPPKK
jgi:hypothetical protein